jgi:hypothetical protein
MLLWFTRLVLVVLPVQRKLAFELGNNQGIEFGIE